MTRRSMSLMDVIAPPGNDWLKQLSRRRSDLPAGVHVVRFGDADDDLAEDSSAVGAKSDQRAKMAA